MLSTHLNTDSEPIVVTELLGDGIGPELESALTLLSESLPVNLHFEKIDWSVSRREKEGRLALDEGIDSLKKNRLAIKYPTETRSESPNAILRRNCQFSVIYRPVFSIPGITSNFTQPMNLHIVRVATGGTYEDPGQLIGDQAAVSLRLVERKPCEDAAHFAFKLARSNGWHLTSASKHTIQRVTDGLFESIVSDVHTHYPDTLHHQELFDALLGKLVISPEKYQVVLVLNEYGDFLSDLASGLIGSIGTGASGTFAFDEDHRITMAMFDPAGGTAPDIAGKDLCNPSALFMAFAMLLDHLNKKDLAALLQQSILSAIAEGDCTKDLGGKMHCSQFTESIISRIKHRLL